MDYTQQLLQVSAKLYQHLTDIPSEESRDVYIEKINIWLDERGVIIDTMQQNGFQIESGNKLHDMLVELDNGIRERLKKVMKVIQQDLKDLQNAKKNEKQYLNPYSEIAVMDGRYYDKKN